MKRYRHSQLFLLCLGFSLMVAPVVEAAAPFADTPPFMEELQKIQSSIHVISPFLHGTLPKEIIDRIFAFASGIPVSVTFGGRGIRAGELFSALFPVVAKKYPIKGTLDFSITSKRLNARTISIHLRGILKEPKTSLFSFKAKSVRLICALKIVPSSRHVTGTLKCEIDHPTLSVPAFPADWRASRATFIWTVRDRHFTSSATLRDVASPRLSAGKNLLRDILIHVCSLTHEKIVIQDLFFSYRKQPIQCRKIALDFSSMALRLEGKMGLNAPLPLPGEHRNGRLRGNVTLRMKGCLFPSRFSLSGRLRADDLSIPELSDLPPGRLKIRFETEGNRLSVPDFQLSLRKDITLKGSFRVEDLTRPLQRGKTHLHLSFENLPEIAHLMRSLFPAFPASLELTGALNAEIRAWRDEKAGEVAGTIHFQGGLSDPSIPLTCRAISLSLPFHVRRLPPGAMSRFTPRRQSGSLHAKNIQVGIVPVQDFSCHVISIPDKIALDEISFGLFKGKTEGRGHLFLRPPYPWGIFLRGRRISLHDICGHIEGFRDALSGRVKTALTLTGNGGKLSAMEGSFIARTVKTGEEPLRISQVFIRKLTGKKGRFFFYQKYRPYDKGVIKARIKRGIIIFDTLELSHKFLGFKDLSIAVSGLSNKISIRDLAWEVLQASKVNVGEPVIKTK